MHLPLAEAYAVSGVTMLGHFMDPDRIAQESRGKFADKG
jgi:hypothetical protein